MKKYKTKKTKNESVTDNTPCNKCQKIYGASDDPKGQEEWWSCMKCKWWFHSSCAKETGLLDDDDSFCCADCI